MNNKKSCEMYLMEFERGLLVRARPTERYFEFKEDIMTKFYASTSEVVSDREQEHMAVVRSLAAECMVFLENNGALPL